NGPGRRPTYRARRPGCADRPGLHPLPEGIGDRLRRRTGRRPVRNQKPQRRFKLRLRRQLRDLISPPSLPMLAETCAPTEPGEPGGCEVATFPTLAFRIFPN